MGKKSKSIFNKIRPAFMDCNNKEGSCKFYTFALKSIPWVVIAFFAGYTIVQRYTSRIEDKTDKTKVETTQNKTNIIHNTAGNKTITKEMKVMFVDMTKVKINTEILIQVARAQTKAINDINITLKENNRPKYTLTPAELVKIAEQTNEPITLTRSE